MSKIKSAYWEFIDQEDTFQNASRTHQNGSGGVFSQDKYQRIAALKERLKDRFKRFDKVKKG